MRKIYSFLLMLFLSVAGLGQATHVVISQVYGAGGNGGATYTNDFIELFNPTGSSVDLTGWSVQYASSTGSSWSVTNLAGSIAPGKYYLIQEAAGATPSTALPTPDATGTISMAAGAGKVALVNSTTSITTCPTGPSIIDLVGYGTASTCFEGSGPTGTIGLTSSAQRASNGCIDTDNNSSDFSVAAVNPRNSATAANMCTPPLAVPTATPAGGITASSFAANWGVISGATGYRLDVSLSPTFSTGATASDLFISEYVEGTSFNKYLEIFNGTGAPVDLSDYELRLYANGSTTFQTLALSGILNDNSTVVFQHGSAVVYSGTATSSSTVINFNGDDAIALFKISLNDFVDIFGKIGFDPGTDWGSGGTSTVDKTLRRKSSVTGGVTTNPSVDGFPTLASEWDIFTTDDVSGLGNHSISSPFFVPGYEDLAVTSNSQVVSGLSASTTYYYRVRAVDGSTTTGNSNVIQVTTADEAPPGPTPVELISFAGRKEGTKNVLSWRTATEINNKGFEVQHSKNGEDYTTLAFVPSQSQNGNSTIQLQYSYVDQNPDGEKHYYRLRQLDYDGNKKLSNIVLIRGEQPVRVMLAGVFPNPARESINVIVEAPEREMVTLVIADISGRILQQQVADAENGSNTLSVNTSHLVKGIYLLKLVSRKGGESNVVKFIKQ